MSQYKTKHINDFTKKELQELGSKGQLIDVRQPEEYELGQLKIQRLLNKVKIKLTMFIAKVVIEVEKQVNFLHNADTMW